MAGIYQEIWNADQAQNGIEAILDTETGSQDQGYVKVNSRLDADSAPDLRVLNVAPDAIPITNWRLEDKNGRSRVLEEKVLTPGEFFTVRLSGEDVQLSNKGGEISLYDNQAKRAHRVSYSKAQVRRQGATILF